MFMINKPYGQLYALKIIGPSIYLDFNYIE